MAFSLEEARQIGEDIGIDWDSVEFTPEDFQIGLDIELEHGTERGEEVNVTEDDPRLTGMIAWAHLMESPLYYDEEKGLPAFEKELEGGGEEEAKTAAYDPHAEGYEIAKELIYGEEADHLSDVVRKYYERIRWAIVRYGHHVHWDRMQKLPSSIPEEDRREIEALRTLWKASGDLLLALGKAEELYYDEEEEDDEGGYGMDRSEGATYRSGGAIIHNSRVYVVAKRRYEGPPLETGKTSIGGGAAPAIKWLAKQGAFQPGMRVLDWGAGKVARNADFLRNLGCEVYAYDPFNATGGDGWEMGSVSDQKPPRGEKFDVGFSSFVLNVVPEHVEDEILRDMGAYTRVMYHIVRNRDIYKMAYNALTGTTNNPWIVDFFTEKFADEEELQAWEEGTVYEEDIEAFCQFGFQSGKGKFQRIPSDLEDKGYRIIKETDGFTIYSNA